ncbi:uncharacterized protein BXZ73DRAFT_99501 [Epithele typhae]|uniref:uncharacterized protein n=1 Tax=Epithele typhae TaxID=378194 RepID=UPI0020076317|nr:uncharacterized protein BXZ73DRAFT_99501 [Epithele typhae]KAH9939299.1 hypothetical protein BXZ73DRAFT_99501 [Epithele typhae]
MTSDRSAEELEDTLGNLPSPNGPNPGDKTTQPIFDCVEAFEMSELAIQSCAADGYCLFSSLLFLRRDDDCAYVLYPKYKFEVGQEIPDQARWVMHGAAAQFKPQEQRDVLHALHGNICYAGTFYANLGPVSLPYAQISAIWPQKKLGLLTELARKTLGMSPPYEQSDKEHYIKIVKDLYLSGSLPVQFLGLQRVWFNTKLFGILDAEYQDHLNRKAQEQEQTISARPARRKRKRAPENVEGGSESGRPSGSNAPRMGSGGPRPVGAD